MSFVSFLQPRGGDEGFFFFFFFGFCIFGEKDKVSFPYTVRVFKILARQRKKMMFVTNTANPTAVIRVLTGFRGPLVAEDRPWHSKIINLSILTISRKRIRRISHPPLAPGTPPCTGDPQERSEWPENPPPCRPGNFKLIGFSYIIRKIVCA